MDELAATAERPTWWVLDRQKVSIEDEKYLHPMRRSEMAAELRRAPCADDSRRTLETWIPRVIVHSIEPTKLPDRAGLRLRHSKQ